MRRTSYHELSLLLAYDPYRHNAGLHFQILTHLPAKESTYLQGGNDNISKTTPEIGQEQLVSGSDIKILPNWTITKKHFCILEMVRCQFFTLSTSGWRSGTYGTKYTQYCLILRIRLPHYPN
jgi:hypothetical protein